MDQLKVRRFGAMTAVATFALVVLAACGGGGSVEGDVTRVPELSEAAAQATNEAATGATPGAAAETSPAAAAQTVEIDSIDIAFEPKAVTIPANTGVKVVLPNKGVTAHNFSIDALDISVDLPAGETKEVIINAAPGNTSTTATYPVTRKPAWWAS